MYEGHIDKAKGGGFEDEKWRWVGQGAWWGKNGNNCT